MSTTPSLDSDQRRASAGLVRRAVRLAVAAGLALAAVGLGGCGGSSSATSSAGGHAKGGFTIGYANGYIGNTWRSQFVADIQAQAAAFKQQGLISSLLLENSPDNVTTQISQLNDFLGRHLSAILVDPVSAAAVNSAAPRAKAEGTTMFISNDPAPTSSNINIVGDNATWWKLQTEWLCQQLGGKGNIVMITGVPGNTADVQRIAAAQAVLKQYPGIKVLTSVPGYWDEAKARTAMSNVLATYHSIDGILEQDVMAQGVIEAFQSAGRPLPKVMTGDYTAGFLRLWAKTPGLKSIGVPYSPTLGADSLGFAVRLLQGKTLKPASLSPNPENPSIKNAVLIPPTLAITRDGKPGPWTPAGMKVISLNQALALVAGKPDSYAVQSPLSQATIDGYFG